MGWQSVVGRAPRRAPRPALSCIDTSTPVTNRSNSSRPLRTLLRGSGGPGLASLPRQRLNQPIVDLGDEDPLYTRNIANGPPDRRRVSLRWLAGSVLTGIFSFGLVGGALQAAIGLDEYLTIRAAVAHTTVLGDSGAVPDKGDLVRPVPENEVTRRVIQISTVTRSEGRELVR